MLSKNGQQQQQQQQQPLHILAFGDSLTEGYYRYGLAFHPYATHLTNLFDSANIPVKIHQQGVSGERVVPSMVKRLHRLLENNVSYDWIIILGGTNDLGSSSSAEDIFKKGLEPMYEMCLNRAQSKAKLVAMTVIENAHDSPTHARDKNRQELNRMIRDYVANANDQNRVYLVDLDKGIPYHSVDDNKEREQIWDDTIHLTAAGYDRMATLIFDAIKDRI
ncbi:unnamed protein product [Rotaria sordida]|uniref:SGNH hydrolase-type esterase domain-containing protein n=1 Tax=Rotaria sordida TaxID=392033 RepID=A0A814H7U7_9BILA|nr:unnamed protein product [Rotaria sordida]CAF3575308.1 unnamed protein product [Rotaria sordida]